MSACETTNTGPGAAINKKIIPPPAALFGFSHLYGGIPGGQAEFVRVPKGNFNPFKVNGSLSDEKVLFLSDILPTAWQAVTNANITKGSTVAIYGAGPVGLLSAACAKMLGAEQIFVVDHNDYRLALKLRAVRKLKDQALQLYVNVWQLCVVAGSLVFLVYMQDPLMIS